MNSTNIPYPRPAHLIAAEKAEQERRVAALEAEERAARQREAEAAKQEADRQKRLAEVKAELDRELDGVYAEVTKRLPFAGVAARIEGAVAKYQGKAGELGERWGLDQAFLRHPVARLLPWLKTTFPERGER